jgi:hypothetical protein
MNPKTMPRLLAAERRSGQVCVRLQDLLEPLQVICRFVKSAEHLIRMGEARPRSFHQIIFPATGCLLSLYMDTSHQFIHSLVRYLPCPCPPCPPLRIHHFGIPGHQATGNIIILHIFISFVDYVFVSACNSTGYNTETMTE